MTTKKLNQNNLRFWGAAYDTPKFLKIGELNGRDIILFFVS